MLAAIDARLGHPTADPHGDPIPAPDGSVAVVSGILAAELGEGEAARVVRISDRDPAVLREVTAARIALGSTVRGGELAADVAEAVWVQRVS